MSTSPSEEAQKLLQNVAEFLPLDYPAERCSDSPKHGQVCGSCLRLETLDATICKHLEDVKKLLRMRAEVKERLNQHHDRLTFHLPAEITSLIFALYTINFNSDFDPQNPTVKYGGPLLLGAVSRSWREVSFGTPQLWKTVNIHIPSNDRISTKVELTKQWLDRSHQLPLYLSIVNSQLADYTATESLRPLFNLLRNVAHRWRMLTLGISPHFHDIFRGELTCAPSLETLKLINNPPGPGEFCLPNTPSLKHLDLQLDYPLSDISIEWGNLTTFEADLITVDEFFEVLRLIEGLKTFRVRGFIRHAGEYPLPVTPLTHSALKQLYLENTHRILESDRETLLDLVEFPSLEKFGYGSSGKTSFPKRNLQSLFSRSHCPLTHFHLSGKLEDATSDDLHSILSNLPTITHLKLEDNSHQRLEDAILSDDLLRRLTPTLCGEVVQTRLLPHLQSLEFLGYKTFSWSCLANLVSTTASDSGSVFSQGQGSPTNSIRRILFRVYHGPGTEIIDTNSIVRLKSACDAGISINIVNEAPPSPHLINPAPPFLPVVHRVYPFDVFP